jgi:hypothetical protein
MLRFAAENVWVDLDEHARLLAGAQAHAAGDRVADAIEDLERADTLYRGDLLDPENRYEEWVQSVRERVQRASLGRSGAAGLSARLPRRLRWSD